MLELLNAIIFSLIIIKILKNIQWYYTSKKHTLIASNGPLIFNFKINSVDKKIKYYVNSFIKSILKNCR